jgi:hypothetical protein
MPPSSTRDITYGQRHVGMHRARSSIGHNKRKTREPCRAQGACVESAMGRLVLACIKAC